MLKKGICLCISFLILLLNTVTVLGANETVAIYIAANGSDSNPGTMQSPLLTLEAARDKAAEINDGSRDIIIYLREGTYNRNESFVLTEKDSGKNGKTITYTAYPGEKVNITGGVSIPPEMFTSVKDNAILEKLDPKIVQNVVQVDLKALGINEFPTPTLTATTGILPWMEKEPNNAELFFNDTAMTIARWPNDGEWAIVESISDPGAHPRLWADDEKGGPNWVPPEDRDPTHGFVMGYSDPRVEKWADEKNAMMWGFWWYDWYDQIVRIKEINTKNKTITSEQPSMYMAQAGTKYYAFNILSELDAPGEYYLDIDTGILYFYPPDAIQTSTIGYSVMTEPLVSMQSAQNIVISDMTFELTRGMTIYSDDQCQNNRIVGCTICNTAGDAVNMSGKNNGVEFCTIYNVNGGVTLSGGNRETLERGENYVENCHIYNFARISQTYTNAFALNGVGNRASNNKVHTALHQAVSFSGNDHLIENNEISDVLLNTDDAGAIYTGRNLTMRGNVIRNNFIHHLGIHSDENQFSSGHKATGTGAIGIYLDDGFSSASLEDNLLYQCDTGIFINGGRDNTAKGNILLEVAAPFYITDIMYDASGDGTWANNGFGLYKDGTTEPVVPFRDELYSKYPHMNEIESDDPRQPKYNSIVSNISTGSKLITPAFRVITEGIYYGMNTVEDTPALTVTESDFKDPDSGDFTPTDSFAKKLEGISNFDFSKIGIQDRPDEETINTIEIDQVSTSISSDFAKDAVILFVNSPKAMVNGERTYIDRKNTSVTPIIINERTLIPIRFAAEGLGAEVSWSADTNQGTIALNGSTIEITPGSSQMFLNAQSIELEQAAMNLNDRLYIPLRSFAEALSKEVYWNPEGLIIISDHAIDVTGQEKTIDTMIKRMK